MVGSWSAFDYSTPGQVTIDMVDYMTKMVDEFPFSLSKPVPTPAAENIFQVDETSPLLDQERAEIFHTFVAKALFACKRSHCDLQVAVAMLCTRVKGPMEEDWKSCFACSNTLNFCLTMYYTCALTMCDKIHVEQYTWGPWAN